MTRRVRDVLLGVILTLVALTGVLYQVAAATPTDSTGAEKMPRLVCPFH
jgi:hypothetical protein